MTLKPGLINDVQLRFLCPQDLNDVKRLCRAWFPIEYPDAWYYEITSNPKFFSLAATYSKSIIGLLVAEVKHKSSCNREDSGIISCAYGEDAHVAYILTIGVVKEYRRHSIGSLLLDSLVSHLTTPEQCYCKAIYLHVLASNQVAVQFYERRRFYKFRFLPLYYAINGVHRDGHLYVLYINGAELPWSFSHYLVHWKEDPTVKTLQSSLLSGELCLPMAHMVFTHRDGAGFLCENIVTFKIFKEMARIEENGHCTIPEVFAVNELLSGHEVTLCSHIKGP